MYTNRNRLRKEARDRRVKERKEVRKGGRREGRPTNDTKLSPEKHSVCVCV